MLKKTKVQNLIYQISLLLISIHSVNVDTVNKYKYMGVHTDNKAQIIQHLPDYAEIVLWFYESAILFAVECWSSRLRAADSNKLNKVICNAAGVMGLKLDSKESMIGWQMLQKLQSIGPWSNTEAHEPQVSDDPYQKYI